MTKEPSETRLERLRTREAALMDELNRLPEWGAAVAAYGEELKGVQRAIALETQT